ncbi:hypothetical protein ACHAPT_000134 [Fusarium lateritium]
MPLLRTSAQTSTPTWHSTQPTANQLAPKPTQQVMVDHHMALPKVVEYDPTRVSAGKVEHTAIKLRECEPVEAVDLKRASDVLLLGSEWYHRMERNLIAEFTDRQGMAPLLPEHE